MVHDIKQTLYLPSHWSGTGTHHPGIPVVPGIVVGKCVSRVPHQTPKIKIRLNRGSYSTSVLDVRIKISDIEKIETHEEL